MFKRILIANRGEIACRIIRTARKMGVESVAVFSDADRHSKHVTMSDHAVHIGSAAPLESYLKMDNIVTAALKTGAQGIHPGYGFLSQNGRFADLCDEKKVKFIGPSGSAMDRMGSKSESKDIMIKAGVPVTPGYHGSNQDPDFLLQEARKIKYPVMIKAVMGGGGKGMKVAWNDKEFVENLQSAKREALKSFGDDRVLLEKFVTRPRHYEIQVFGDNFGNYAFLFERDCSIQRRHQKVIEEAPSGLTPEQREKMGKTACEAARAVGYVNAGTVEFLYDLDTKEFYFMEMNTRLQVEHPVTEMITGLDLVEWQLRIASGERLPKLQNELKINGHSLEARVYSEDPFTFLPGRGTIEYYREPENARVDSGVLLGSEVGIWYDPMISKLIVWGEDRPTAISKLNKALGEYKIGGLVTNLPLLKRIVNHKNFKEFNYDLKFMEEYADEIIPKGITIGNQYLAAGVFAALNSFDGSLPVETNLSNFRLNYNFSKSFNFQIRNAYSQSPALLVFKGKLTEDRAKKNHYSISGVMVDDTGKEVSRVDLRDVEIHRLAEDRISYLHQGVQTEVTLYQSQNKQYVFDTEGNNFEFQNSSDWIERKKDEIIDREYIKSQMPGIVVRVAVKAGDTVKKGDAVAYLEAMKMEHKIVAQEDAKIAEVLVKEKAFVEAGQPLVKLAAFK